MKLFWKLFLSVCTCMMLAFSACGTFLIHSGFKSAREKDIQNGYNNASVVCINLVQNVKLTINLVYRDTGYEKQKMLSYVRQRNRFLSGMPERKYSLHFGQTKRQEFTVRMDSRGQTCQSAGTI